MSQWNLSVRLTGQGSDLSRTLRTTARDAQAASRDVNALRRDIGRLRADARNNIRIRLGVDAANLRRDVRAALTSAGAGQDLRIRLGVDAAHLRRDVQAALTTAGAGQDLRVRLGVDAAHLRRDVQAALTTAGSGQALGIRLDVDADHLRADVQTAVTAAGSGQGLGIRLDVDAGHLRDDVSAALTNAGAGQGLRVRLDVDAGHLRDDVNAALTAAGAGQGLAVNLRLADAMQFRRDVEDAVRWAAWGHRIQIPIGLADPMQLRRDVSNAVRWASMTQTITVRVNPDTSALNGLGRTLNGGGGGGGGQGGMRGVLSGLLMLAPAAIPLAAGLSTALAPLPGMFAAGGVAAGAFGAAIAGQIEPLSEVADAEKKYQEAVRDHGKSSAEAIKAQVAYQQVLAALPPDAQRAAAALSQLKENFSSWSNDMAGFTMTPLTNGITVLDQLIPRLTPEVKSASTQLDRLVSIAGGAVSTPGFDAMADRFAEFTDRQLDEMTDGVVHFLRLLSEGQGVSSGPLAEFIAYAKENGPAAREALSAISAAVVTLMRGAAEAGPSMLTLVTAAARLVAALPPELVGIILQVATALKLLQLSGAGMAALAGGLAAVRTRIAALAATAAAAGGGLAGLRAAFLSLGTAAKASVVVAGIGLAAVAISKLKDIGKEAPPDVDRLTTSLGNLGRTGKATGYVAQRFGADFGKLNDQIKKVTNPSVVESINNWGADITGGLLDAGDATEKFTENADAIDKSLTNLVRNGNAALAKAALADMMKGLDAEEAAKFRGELDAYDQALADLAFEQKLTAESQGLFGQAAQETSAKLSAQKASADGLRQSIVALNEVNRAAGSAMSAFEQSLDDATAAAKEQSGALKMRDGDLDLGSQKSRDAEKVLSDLATNTEAAASAAREQGRSWEYVQGIMTRGQEAFVQTAVQMGLTKTQAEALARSYLSIPEKKSMTLEMRTEDAITGLDAVIAAIQKTPGKKSVTVDALTTDAVGLLEDLGFKVTKLPNGKFTVTANTKTAQGSIAAVQRARDALKNKTLTIEARDRASAAVRDIQAAIAGLRNRTVTITTVRQTIATYSTDKRPTTGQGGVSKYADGGIARAADGLFVPGYAPRRDIVPAILSPGEGVLVPETVRKLGASTGLGGQGIIKALNTWGRYGTAMRFADGGIADGVQHFASGGFTYSPTGTMKSASDVQSSYSGSHQPISKDDYNKKLRARANAVDALRAAEARLVQVRKHKHTHAQLVAAENAVAKARRGVATATDAARAAEARYKKQFSLSDWGKTLASAVKANTAYEANLKKIAARGGSDVIDQLRDMGAEGATMVSALAKASNSQFNSIVANLRKLGPLAKATLADFTAQMNASTKTNSTFQANLAKLAGMGYGDLATQLAAQGDDAAQKLAAEAVKSKSAAGKANTAAKNNANTLSGEQLGELVQIIAAIKTKTTGIHDVAGSTGLGEDEIITVANKAKAQINSSLGSRASRFLDDLWKANRHMAYANGGLRAGIYSTQAGIIRFAEPETHGEGYIPLAPSKRRTALPVLADVAHRFGVGLTDAQATRPIVIVRGEGDTHVNVTAVRSGATASDIASQVGRQMRRFRRGGVAARAA